MPALHLFPDFGDGQPFVALFPEGMERVSARLMRRYGLKEEEALDAVTDGIILFLERYRNDPACIEIMQERISEATQEAMYRKAKDQLKNRWRRRERRRALAKASGESFADIFVEGDDDADDRMDNFFQRSAKLPPELKETLRVFSEIVVPEWSSLVTPQSGVSDGVATPTSPHEYWLANKQQFEELLSRCAGKLGVSLRTLGRRVKEILRSCELI